MTSFLLIRRKIKGRILKLSWTHKETIDLDSMSDFEDEPLLRQALGSLSVAAANRTRPRRVLDYSDSSESPTPSRGTPAHKSRRRSSGDRSSAPSQPSTPPPPSPLPARDPRPNKLIEPFVASRLARYVSTLPPDSKAAKTARKILKAADDPESAPSWFLRHGATCPEDLANETIADLLVTYPDPVLAEQRRFPVPFVCLMALAGASRAAATYGLYIDLDIAGSKFVAIEHAARLCRIPRPRLSQHLDQRPDDLAEVCCTAHSPHVRACAP